MLLDQLKNALKEKNVIIGSRRTLKYLKLGNVKLVVIANNCPETIRKDINHYAKMSKLKVEGFNGTAKQLGVFCGKPFPIATLSIKSEPNEKL